MRARPGRGLMVGSAGVTEVGACQSHHVHSHLQGQTLRVHGCFRAKARHGPVHVRPRDTRRHLRLDSLHAGQHNLQATASAKSGGDTVIVAQQQLQLL